MIADTDFAVITDIGSTTTKAVLLDLRDSFPKLLGIEHAPTTVENPHNDVGVGILNSISKLEIKTGLSLLCKQNELSFAPRISYFSTSSAGGGLQILVIGLTMFDSASSGKRCAYGAGGVILDTFAVDDKRQAMEQMLAMRNLHPDMILLCGGTDGGAISGVLRMAEILRIANPEPKFDSDALIPALYAGNRDAVPIIKQLISHSFDLHILPNLRPSLEEENLSPTQNKIQQLFMETVMEHAPGYSAVKHVVKAPIIPTPMGVQRALAQVSGKERRNIFAFDIGGATTDVFSIINTHFQRTVSANLGMSYSAWNILKESGIERIMKWLPRDTDVQEVRNYIANKCLHPTHNPSQSSHFRIEHALAREALSIALSQHRNMHYNSEKIGYLDRMKKDELCKYQLQFAFQNENQKHYFKESDIEILIGAGGVFAHAQNKAQCMLIMVDAIRPKGITELWIDRDFISPHLGVLSETDSLIVEKLMYHACFEKIALHIAPLFNPKTKKALLHIEVSDHNITHKLEIMPDTLTYLPAETRYLSIKPAPGVQLPSTWDISKIETELPLLIDTRLEPGINTKEFELLIGLYPDLQPDDEAGPEHAWELSSRDWIRKVELPYAGDIHFNKGDLVEPTDTVAVNRFNPPRLYILNGFASLRNITPLQISQSLKVKEGDLLDFDQIYGELCPDYKETLINRSARQVVSPVRGKIEYIDPNTGILVLSEIQDYSSKPVTVHFADKLMLKPKHAKRYLLHHLNDFVYQGELLAKRIERNADGAPPVIVKAPATGTITSIDNERGVLTIAYVNKALDFAAHVHGKVEKVIPGRSIEIAYSAKQLKGKIAFGRECHGVLRLVSSQTELIEADLHGAIAALCFAPSAAQLRKLAQDGAKAILCYRMDATELTSFLDYEPGIINTGNESLPLTVLIIDGFGTEDMPSTLRRLLPENSSCFINPHTRIRAGVVRPFICF